MEGSGRVLKELDWNGIWWSGVNNDGMNGLKYIKMKWKEIESNWIELMKAW